MERFPDGEVSVTLGESVRAREVFVLQPTSPGVDDHLVELLAFADACRRGAAGRLTAVVPYFGYARSDKRKSRREPVMARVAADLLQADGVRHLLVLDVHTPQLEGFFAIPVDNLTAVPVLSGYSRTFFACARLGISNFPARHIEFTCLDRIPRPHAQPRIRRTHTVRIPSFFLTEAPPFVTVFDTVTNEQKGPTT